METLKPLADIPVTAIEIFGNWEAALVNPGCRLNFLAMSKKVDLGCEESLTSVDGRPRGDFSAEMPGRIDKG